MSNTTTYLDWPVEAAERQTAITRWAHVGSNICLDFHGDPCRAKLVVFSDGNHHMALEACLQAFLAQHPEAMDIFYATTPPAVLVQLLRQGTIRLGNLCLSRQPDVFIGPQNILMQLAADGLAQSPRHFMRSRCNVLLVTRGNPRRINGIADLLREEIRLFISNPDTEQASYQVYAETLLNLATEQGLDLTAFQALLSGRDSKIIYGERIHHRELPQALADGRADVALVYYHLALRYTRIFPDLFQIIPLGGSPTDPQPTPAHHITDYSAAIINQANPLSQALMDHLFSQQTTDIYHYHGLNRP